MFPMASLKVMKIDIIKDIAHFMAHLGLQHNYDVEITHMTDSTTKIVYIHFNTRVIARNSCCSSFSILVCMCIFS